MYDDYRFPLVIYIRLGSSGRITFAACPLSGANLAYCVLLTAIGLEQLKKGLAWVSRECMQADMSFVKRLQDSLEEGVDALGVEVIRDIDRTDNRFQQICYGLCSIDMSGRQYLMVQRHTFGALTSSQN